MNDNTREVQELVTFTCPFCGLKASAIKPAGVVHEMPACLKFLELDVVDYLAAVNAALAKENRS